MAVSLESMGICEEEMFVNQAVSCRQVLALQKIGDYMSLVPDVRASVRDKFQDISCFPKQRPFD